MKSKPDPKAAGKVAVAKAIAAVLMPNLGAFPFSHRGFSNGTIEALINAKIDFPERLLFMSGKSIEAISGLNKSQLTEIKAYVLRFRDTQLAAIR
jgi:hypothetical protein